MGARPPFAALVELLPQAHRWTDHRQQERLTERAGSRVATVTDEGTQLRVVLEVDYGAGADRVFHGARTYRSAPAAARFIAAFLT